MNSRVVITGIGIVSALGNDRETTWEALKQGQSGVGQLRDVPYIPEGLMPAALVRGIEAGRWQQRTIPLALTTAAEAIQDSYIDECPVDKSRFGCSVAANIGITPALMPPISEFQSHDEMVPWFKQFLPCTIGTAVSQQHGLEGPLLCNSTACASGTVALLNAYRSIQCDQCDVALAGASQTIHPLLAAGFYNMRVLAQHADPKQACRPFDVHRSGFVMGEGSAMFVLERLDHALARQAPIYAEIVGGHLACDAHHVTSLDDDSAALNYLIRQTLGKARLQPTDIAYINAHGTGTKQNDVMETRGIREAFGPAANDLCLSSTKAVLGHMLNASGAVELAVTALTLRDGFAPPTINLTEPDPDCDLDCIPFVGRQRAFEHALKLSIAFGGNLAAVALRRWSEAGERTAPLPMRRAA